MYNQSTQAVSRRSIRSYSTAVRSRNRSARSQERVRLLQLAVCLVLFFTVFLWKGAFPQRMSQVREDILTLISTDFDFEAALAGLGESLASGDTMLSDLGTFCINVFGPVQEDEPARPAAYTPFAPVDGLEEELHFLSRKEGTAARTAYYASLSSFGLELPEAVPEPEPQPEPVTEPVAEPEPVAVPAAGTVVAVSDYSGDPLPNNYTMDQLSLGDLETITPVLGRLTSIYGYRDHPINGRYHFHGGVDIAGNKGDPIAAFASGTVEYTGEDDSYGLYLQLDHGNGVKSFYAHCSKIVVTKGQQVALGEKIAEIGSTGSATGSHLHLELKYNKMHLDPVYYVEFTEQ